MRRLVRAVLTLLMAGSLALTLLTGLRIAQSPDLAPIRDRTVQEIVAATDAMMTREATAERLSDLIRARLAEDPRNWVTLQALAATAEERGLELPPDLRAAYDAAWAEDESYTHIAGECAACAWDIAACSLTNVFICKAPILLTPADDVRGIVKAGWDHLGGGEVDQLDLGLSVVGLGATGLVIASGGSSATIKLGAGVAKLARGMKVLSPRLAALIVDAMRGGVDWGRLARLDEAADLPKAVRLEALAPVAAIASDLGRMNDALGPVSTLHLLRYVDDGADARRMARASEALGPRTVARAEVLGPARLMRATLRISETAWQVLAGLLGLIGSVALMVSGMLQGAALRALRRAARGRRKPSPGRH